MKKILILPSETKIALDVEINNRTLLSYIVDAVHKYSPYRLYINEDDATKIQLTKYKYIYTVDMRHNDGYNIQSIIDEKIRNLQEFDKETRDELMQERDDIVRDILRKIDKVIQDYGKKNGYTVILNDRMLVYGNETIDVTQDIVDILNK